MNQGFMPSLRQNRRYDYMNYAIAEAPTPHATKNVSSAESRLLQLEKLASTIPPPQTFVASLQGVLQVGVHPQYTNAIDPALQRLNQRH